MQSDENFHKVMKAISLGISAQEILNNLKLTKADFTDVHWKEILKYL